MSPRYPQVKIPNFSPLLHALHHFNLWGNHESLLVDPTLNPSFVYREVHSARDDSLAIVPTPPANGMSSTTSHNSLAIATTTYNHARTVRYSKPSSIHNARPNYLANTFYLLSSPHANEHHSLSSLDCG